MLAITRWYPLPFVVLALAAFPRELHSLDIHACNEPLGMESGAIPDEWITASSSYYPNVGPKNGRLRVEKEGGGWCPKQQVERGVREHLQVALAPPDAAAAPPRFVVGVQTQGRYDRGRGQEYAEEYTLEYWRPGLGGWRQYRRWDGKQIFRGNSDTSTVETHRLMPAIFASKVRILPYSIHRRTVCLRMELLGCPYEDGIASYSAPESAEAAQGLSDATYDGQTVDGVLYNGLGRLVDGEYGLDNFRLDIGYGKGNGWVSWTNDSLPGGYVELLFEFDQVRNFSAVRLHANNFFSRNVQVFSKAKVAFSVGGSFFNGPTLSYAHAPDRALEHARNVSVDLRHRLGRYVRIKLYFADRRIMLSEVAFDSAPVNFNATEEESMEPEENELLITSGDGKALDAFETVAAKKDGDGSMEVVIGALTAVALLLMVVFVVVLLLNKRHKLQGSPTLLRNPFGLAGGGGGCLETKPNDGAATAPVTPGAADRPAEDYEPYRSPLVSGGGYYAPPNYATIRCAPGAAAADGVEAASDEPPAVPPLPAAPDLLAPPPPPPPPPPPVYRPPAAAVAPFVREEPAAAAAVAVGDARKRCHTAPREKHRMPPPVVCWNIAPSMTHSYSCREAELVPIPRYTLRPVETVGACHAGEIALYETDGLEDIVPGAGHLVAVRTSSPRAAGRAKSDATGAPLEALREVRFLAALADPNVCRVLGVCTAEAPPWTVVEYGEMGDLAQYLQFLVHRNGGVGRPDEDQPIGVASLVFMAGQIASGMRYLESRHVVHKDLAARNCLVGRGYLVKIADVAMCKPQYKKDYAEIGGRPPAPIRWLPWESILLDRYSCASSVWAFGVTLWEILNFCCERPFANLSNEKVIQNAEHMYYGGELQVLLNKPTICSPDLYELMCSCWRRDDEDRPTFKQIFAFLRHVDKDYDAYD